MRRIKFKTAKLAKEAGIWISSRYSYDESGILEDSIDMTGFEKFTTEDILMAKENGYDCYLAPTQYKLQTVLRKKFNTEISINIYNSVGSFKEYKAQIFYDLEKIKCKKVGPYEKTLELALQLVLKEIIKNK